MYVHRQTKVTFFDAARDRLVDHGEGKSICAVSTVFVRIATDPEMDNVMKRRGDVDGSHQMLQLCGIGQFACHPSLASCVLIFDSFDYSIVVARTRFCSHFSLGFFNILQQKNTCAHNNTQKAHANGIKKKKRTKYVSTRGMDPKFLRNQKFAKKYNHSKRERDE